jgi:hypothetical protein
MMGVLHILVMLYAYKSISSHISKTNSKLTYFYIVSKIKNHPKT